MARRTCRSSSSDASHLRVIRFAFPCCAVALASAPLAAQDLRLEDLIPDAAVADPESWAAQGVAAEAAGGVPAPEAPLAPLADVTIAWPDRLQLPPLLPLPADAQPVAFAAFEDVLPPPPAGAAEQVSPELVLVFPADPALFPERAELLRRFAGLSLITQLEDDGALARLAVQARDDEALLARLLRTYGYYDAQLTRSLEQTAAGPQVRFEVQPGARYRIGAVDLGGLAATGADFAALRATYRVQPGDGVALDAIANSRFDLDKALGESGYPFAVVPEPELLIDHARGEGDVALPVVPGGRYAFGTVISNRPEFLSGTHLARMARFDPGEIYQRSLELDLRRAILATGLVGSVTLAPVEAVPPQGTQPGIVNIAVTLSEAPLRTLAGNIGFGSEEGLRLEGSWEHRNLFPPEGSLRLRGILGTREQLAGVTFRKNNFRGRDRILTADLYASTLDYAAYDARTLALTANYEKVSTLLFQKRTSWAVGVETLLSAEREADANGVLGPRQTYFIAALPLHAQRDTSDDLLDPTRGWRLSGRLSPELSGTGGVRSVYLRSQVDAAFYRQIGESVVLAGRTRLASIPGAPVTAIAPSRRLYAGGGGSVRGYGFRQIGPLNATGDPVGGRSLAEFSLEARVRTGLFDGALGVVPFVDAGSVDSDAVPGFADIRFAAGVGLRYLTSFGPLRLDVGVPINPGPNDSMFAVHVALGQAF